MSVFKYADNPEESVVEEDDGLDEQLNEGEPDEGRAPLGAEYLVENDEDDDSDSEDDDDFFLFDKNKGVK